MESGSVTGSGADRRRAGMELLLVFADGALQFRTRLVGNLLFLDDP